MHSTEHLGSGAGVRGESGFRIPLRACAVLVDRGVLLAAVAGAFGVAGAEDCEGEEGGGDLRAEEGLLSPHGEAG